MNATPPVRIGVIGDVHAEDERLERLLCHLTEQRVDVIVCVGDLVTGPGSPDRCVQLLESADVVTVRGNHDLWLLADQTRHFQNGHRPDELEERTLTYLRGLAAQVELATSGMPLLLCHGLGTDDMNNISADDYGYALEANPALQQLLSDPAPRLVVKGHRHRPALWQVRQLTLLDAGCLSEPIGLVGAVIDADACTVTQLGLDAAGVVEQSPLQLLRD